MSDETASAPPRDWDAATYDRLSDVQFAWALEQLERVPFVGDEVVLDAGCGSGRVTTELAQRLPRGRVYGVDVSASMVAHARAALGDRAVILRQDLEDPFRAHFVDWREPWHYAEPQETAARLQEAGFDEVEAWLEPKRVEPPRQFIETVCLLPYLKQLPPELMGSFVDRVLEREGDPLVLQYVRLNMAARRP